MSKEGRVCSHSNVERVQIQVSSAAGQKTRPVEETITDK